MGCQLKTAEILGCQLKTAEKKMKMSAEVNIENGHLCTYFNKLSHVGYNVKTPIKVHKISKHSRITHSIA